MAAASFVSGDPGLPNWEVDLYNSSGVFVASQLTDASGDFDFQGLDPGTYTVAEVVQSRLDPDRPAAAGHLHGQPLPRAAPTSGLQFGDFQNITISGEKFNDLTEAGGFLPGDPGLQGWTIDLFNSAGDIIATTVTDANGNYSFSNVGPGTYTVRRKLQAGWIQTFPAAPGTYTVTATSGQDASGLLFGNFQLVTYAGTVYNDLNGNGVYDPGDPGLKGWTVDLLDSSGNIVATTTSAADGSYSFANLGPGVYTIEEINQTGWYQTEPVNPPGTYTVHGHQRRQPVGPRLRQLPARERHRQRLQRLERQRQPRPGEPGLQGWTVNLLDSSGNIVATTRATPTETTSSTTCSPARSPSPRS